MMGTHGDNPIVIVGWAIGGIFLSVLVLLGLLGGLLVGLLLILMLPLVLPLLIVVALMGGKPGQVVSEEPEAEAPGVLEQAEAVAAAAPVRVLASVLESEGTCHKGLGFEVGQHWTLNGKWSEEGPCRYAEKVFTGKAEQLRAGEVMDGELHQCLGEGYRFVFQFRKVEPEKAAVTA
jgi:hypothetical protein